MLRTIEEGTLEDFLADPKAKVILEELAEHLAKARRKHAPMCSAREGHSVIEEEYIEFRTEVFHDDTTRSFHEAFHLAAMAVRYILDLRDRPELWTENRKRNQQT